MSRVRSRAFPVARTRSSTASTTATVTGSGLSRTMMPTPAVLSSELSTYPARLARLRFTTAERCTVRNGTSLVILSDRGVSPDQAPLPMLLATGAVHHHLVREGLRTQCGLICETGEARDVAQFALLVGYGAGAINPYLAFETLDAMREAGVPLERVGVRLNPSGHGFLGMEVDEETMPTFEHIVTRLNDYPIAFLHLCEPFNDVSDVPHAETQVARRFRPLYDGVLMTNSGFDREKAQRFLDEGWADLVAFGKPFISNPDLVTRLEQGAELATWDSDTFYTPGPRGYIDYPKMPR